ncbi:DNA ligase, partial [Candidatus Woesearchaeota archaeon CG08_land_8_20_14_0_20_43_7]
MEIHRAGDDITFFTRRLENVTKQFPDVAKVILDSTEKTDFILDAEIIGYDKKTKRYLPFQKISKRIRRKYDLEQIQLDIPVVINVFDVLYADGKTLLKAPFSKRREMIASLIKEIPGKIALAEQLVTDNVDVASRFYQEALDMGNEGIMMKNLDGIYKPGARVGYGVKIKPVMETLDVVIIGAEWGEGKRSGWFTSFSVAVQDEDGNLIDIGKVSTGLKEKKEEGTSYEEMTELLNGLITSEKGKEVTVKPEIVIEIKYEEIQRSTNYSSGYALRFPRFVRLREDRGSDDISDISLVEELYDTQRGR